MTSELDSPSSLKYFHIQWHLTDRCNLRCKHCYQNLYARDNEITTEQAKKFIDHYTDVIKKWGKEGSFSLTGGEPLFRQDIFEIIRYCKSKDVPFAIHILTNGTLINEHIADEIKDSDVNGVQISLDGPDAETHDNIRGKGNYERALHGMRLLQERKIPVSLHFVAHKLNVHKALDFIDKGVELGVERLTITTLVPMGSGSADLILSPMELKDLMEKAYQKKKEIVKSGAKSKIIFNRPVWCLLDDGEFDIMGAPCPVGINGLAILPDGTILPCRRFPVKIGNIHEDTLFKVWYTSELLWKMRDRTLVEKCGECEKKDKCYGCRGMAFAYFGDYMKPDPQCWKCFDKLPKMPDDLPKLTKGGYYEVE